MLPRFNGTCYTQAECSALGGSASGTCASSFGVCCVFSIACGGSTSANNSYAIISSYSTSTDKDPCTYTFCKTDSDVCKLRYLVMPVDRFGKSRLCHKNTFPSLTSLTLQ